jgi:hypothetical protein
MYGVQWENGYGDWAPQELGRWALWNTKNAIRHPYPLPQERFHYRGEHALSCVRSVVGRRVLDGERRVSDPCISSTRLMSAGARCDFIPIIFNTYMYFNIFSRSARFVCFLSQGKRGELRWRPGRALLLALCRRTRSSEHHWEFQFTHLHLLLFNRPSFEREWL